MCGWSWGDVIVIIVYIVYVVYVVPGVHFVNVVFSFLAKISF